MVQWPALCRETATWFKHLSGGQTTQWDLEKKGY